VRLDREWIDCDGTATTTQNFIVIIIVFIIVVVVVVVIIVGCSQPLFSRRRAHVTINESHGVYRQGAGDYR
jgi:hypothetical protein